MDIDQEAQEFLKNTSLISYTEKEYKRQEVKSLAEISISPENQDRVKWLNTYGLNYKNTIKSIVLANGLDDFLLKLINDEEHNNKVIELDKIVFFAVRVLIKGDSDLASEQMMFIASNNFVWSIQEKPGDYFEWIRERLSTNRGISRKKNASYLLFLIIESIIDNYLETYEKYEAQSDLLLNDTDIKPTPTFTAMVERRKQELFSFKKAASSLRNTIVKLEKVGLYQQKSKYFSELKEQINNHITDIDFDLQELESKINLIFSIQGHRLNEVMKTLTILSVIFIPLTFLAGIYGMNFKNMPELQTENGYFILLGIMFCISLLIIWYFYKKKWF
jgi:magnesium transporter